MTHLGKTAWIALALAVPLAGVAAFVTCKRHDDGPARAHVPLPTGGAAVEEPDAKAAADPRTSDPAALASLVEDARRYDVRTWSFALDRYEMAVVDAGMSTALDAVLARSDAELVVNGGFFDPQGRPVGLVVSDGAVLSRLAPALSGGVVTSDGERAKLWESESFVMPDGARFALQCRPRLVVEGAPNVKSDDGHRSERTALCLRDGGQAIDVVIVKGATGAGGESAGPSLFALGRYLAQHGCENALNLDGGPSTGVAWREGGEIRVLAPARPVRHALTFRRRGA